MSEVLSQQEIDHLLHSLKQGENQPYTESTPEKEAVLYDFRFPNRISKNQLRVLSSIHESFSEILSSYLVSKLQTIVNINVTSIEQIYYSEYVLSVSNPSCLYTFEIKHTDVKAILELSPEFALTLVDKLLGGNGSGFKQLKPITKIEQKVIQVVIDNIMKSLSQSWQLIDRFDFEVDKFEPDIDFVQITSQNESVLLVSFEILIGDQSYLMNLCFATFGFDPILSKLSAQKISPIRPVKYEGTTAVEIITNHLYKTMLPLSVQFGTSKVSFDDLFKLEVGDIIKLNDKINDEHLVKIGGKDLFMGRTGVVNKHKAIKITKRLELNENLE